VKSDAERGPFGAWAFHARDQLDLSVEQVADDLHYHPASLRKMESGSAPASRRMRRELPGLYRRRALEKGISIPPAPAGEEPAAPSTDVAAAIRELVEEVRASRLVSERSAVVMAELLGALVGGHQPLEGTPDASGARAQSGTVR